MCLRFGVEGVPKPLNPDSALLPSEALAVGILKPL